MYNFMFDSHFSEFHVFCLRIGILVHFITLFSFAIMKEHWDYESAV